MKERNKKKSSVVLIIKRLIKFLKPHKFKFILLFICLTISTLISIYQPLVLGKLVDYITYKKWNAIPKLLTLFVVLFFLNSIFNSCYTYISQIVSNKIQMEIKYKVFNSIFSLTTREFETTQKGEFFTKLDEDISVITSFLSSKVTVVMDIFTVIFIGVILFKLNLKLAIVTILNFPIISLMFLYFGKKMSVLENNNRVKEDKCNNFIQESIDGFNIIKILNVENIINKKFFKLNDNIFNISMKKNSVNAASNVCNGVIGCVFYAAYFGIACYEISKGNLTIGLFVAFNSYSSSFNNSLFKISQINMDFQQALVSVKRIFDLMDKHTEKEKLIDNRTNDDLFKSDIKIENLSFRYRKDENYILKDLNLNIKKNSITAIVGKNGQGKTTLLKILMGLYKDYEGEVLVNDLPLKKIPFSQVSKKISYVPQETFLFTGTIKENLLLANPNASDEDIKFACKLANIDNVVELFKDGYNTQIGYNGISLSGGQKQRLGIARALLRKADLFLFDEITASVDIETEEIIKSILKRISKNKTVILVTHKKNTLAIADNIAVLNDGRVECKEG